MKILWLTLESILPANSGGRIGIFKRLEQISKDNDIYLFYTYDVPEDKKYIKDLMKYCTEVHAYERNKKSKETLKNLFFTPLTVASRKKEDMVRDIKVCIDKHEIDVINVDSPHMCLNLISLKTDIPIVLNQHNIEWKVYKNIAKSSKELKKQFIYSIEAFRFKIYEKYLYRKIKFDLVTFVSHQDLEYFQKTEKNYGKLALVPVGADSYAEHYTWKNGNSNKNIVFVGKMSYSPNIEASIWFAKEVLPQIRSSVNDVEFWIVGKEPVESVLQLSNDEKIHVTGAVDSVEPFYDMAQLVVIPLMHGGGVKIKLLEAIGHKVPVVSTMTGIQGTEFDANVDLCVADTKEEFADLCINILKSPETYESMYEKLFKKFDNNYTWKAVGELYNKLLHELRK